jgi:hypothetical protein
MSMTRFPFAVRLIGFSAAETEGFAVSCEIQRATGCSYFHLADGNLQDPDLYVVNALAIKPSLILSSLPPSDVRPVLLVGSSNPDLPYAQLERVRDWP